jgi:uncharacterized protein (DUF305 family)
LPWIAGRQLFQPRGFAVEDVAWMKAMILHRSIAILTSERERIEDPGARKLADATIESQ